MRSRQRAALAETFRELANYGVAGLVFGQFVGGSIVSWKLIAIGMGLWLVFVTFAMVLEPE